MTCSKNDDHVNDQDVKSGEVMHYAAHHKKRENCSLGKQIRLALIPMIVIMQCIMLCIVTYIMRIGSSGQSGPFDTVWKDIFWAGVVIAAETIIMALAISTVTDRKVRRIEKAKDAVVRMCSGDFRSSIDDSDLKYNDEIAEITDSLNDFISIMQDMLEQLQMIADQTDQQAGDFSDMARNIDESTVRETADIEELKRTLTQISAATQQLAGNASELSQIASETKVKSHTADSEMHDALILMEDARNAAEKIYGITEYAQKAFNRLRGFAGMEDVLASIDRSTRNILIMRDSFEKMTDSFKKAADAVDDVETENSKLSMIADNIAQISEEQALSSTNIAEAAENTAMMVEETEDETSILYEGTRMLSHNASEMKSKMKQFTLGAGSDKT